MPDTAELIISCRGTGTQEVKRFTDAVREADHSSNELIKTTGMLFSTAQMLRYARASVQAFKTQEKASTGLRSALQRLGGEYQAYQSEMEKFSAEMQKVTIYGDQQITMIQAMGLNMGILPDKIQEATKAALGLSAAYNMDVNTSMRLIARAAKGHTEILSRYGIVLDKTKSKEEQYAELLDLGTGNMKLVTAEAQTLRGVLSQAGNAFGDAQEKVGEEFAPAIRDAAGLIKNLSEMFSGASGSTRRFIVLTGALTGALTALKGAAGAKSFLDDLTKATPGGKSAVDMVNAGMAAQRENLRMIKAENLAKSEKAVNGTSAIRDALTFLTKHTQDREQRALLVREQEAAELQSEAAAKRLKEGDRLLYAAKMRLEEARRGVRETGVDWHASIKSGSDPKETARDYSELRYQMAQRTEAYKEYENQIVRVNRLQKELVSSNEAVARSNAVLKDFDKARAAERNYMLNQPGVRSTMAAHNAALASGMGAGEAEKTAQQVYALEVEKQARAAELASSAELKRAEALRLGATEAQADAVKTAYLTEQQRAAAQAEKPRIAAIKARLAALKSGASATAAETAATTAYNKVQTQLAVRSGIAAQAEAAKSAALARGATAAQAAAVANEVLAKAEQRAALQSTMLGRAQLAVAGGAAKAAAGLRGAAVAAGGLVKSFLPMLAISAAIAGIDYLINRTKKAAEGMSEIAGKEADRARAALTTGDHERASDQEKLRRYEELASYADRTAEEQKELISLAGELNGRYKNLVLPLLDQNTALERTVGLWEKISDAQRKARIEQVKQSLDRSRKEVSAGFVRYGLDIESTRMPFLTPQMRKKQGSRLQQLTQKESDAVLYGRELNTLTTEEQIKELEKDIAFYAEKKNNEAYDAAKRQLEMVKNQYNLEKQLYDLTHGKGSLTGEKDSGKKLEETSKESRRLLEMAISNRERDVDEYLSGYSKLREIYSLEGDRLKRKQLISDLNKEELEDYDHEIKQQQKLLNDINQRIKVSGNAEDRQKSVKIAERLIELTRQRAEIESNAVRRDFEESKQAEQENRNFFNSIQQSLFRMRETAGNAIDANSNEAIRLQSRQFLSGGKNQDYQKINAENSKKMNELLKKMQEIETKVQNEVTQIRAAIDKNLRTSTVGG